MKLQEIFEARYYKGGDTNVPFEEPLRSWAVDMWQAIQDDWYNADGDWEWFEEHGLGNPTNTIDNLWRNVPDGVDEDQAYDAYEWAVDQVAREARGDPSSLQGKIDKNYRRYGESLEEGFRQKALAAIATAGLALGGAAKADLKPDLYAYTDDAGETQIVLNYEDVPKGKMARIVKYEDVFGEMDVEEINRQIRKSWKTKNLLYKGPARFKAPDDELSRQMYRRDM